MPYGYDNYDFRNAIGMILDNLTGIDAIPPEELPKISNNLEDQGKLIEEFFFSLNQDLYEDAKKILKEKIDKINFIERGPSSPASVVFPDFTGTIYYEDNIRSLYTLAHEMTHLIGHMRGKGNDNFAEIESFIVENALGKFLEEKNLIEEKERQNQEEVHHNISIHACNLAEEEYAYYSNYQTINDLPCEQQEATSLKNQIRFIYGDVISTIVTKDKTTYEIGNILNDYLNSKQNLNSEQELVSFFGIKGNIQTIVENYIDIVKTTRENEISIKEEYRR